MQYTQYISYYIIQGVPRRGTTGVRVQTPNEFSADCSSLIRLCLPNITKFAVSASYSQTPFGHQIFRLEPASVL